MVAKTDKDEDILQEQFLIAVNDVIEHFEHLGFQINHTLAYKHSKGKVYGPDWDRLKKLDRNPTKYIKEDNE